MITVDTNVGYLQIFKEGNDYNYDGLMVGEQLFELSHEESESGNLELFVEDCYTTKAFYVELPREEETTLEIMKKAKECETYEQVLEIFKSYKTREV